MEKNLDAAVGNMEGMDGGELMKKDKDERMDEGRLA